MFYPISKLLGWFTQPLALLLVGLAVASVLLWSGRIWAGKRLVTACLLLLIAAGPLPLGALLILPLEQRFPRAQIDIGDRIDGIIVLGGAEDAVITQARNTPTMNDASERMSEGLALALRFPAARLVFSGGSGDELPYGASNEETVKHYYRELGFDMRRLEVEGKSRNTHENAEFSKDMVRPKPGERWLLVTSAFHMPRSVGCFRRAGWEVLAWPVDYRTTGRGSLYNVSSLLTDRFRVVDYAAKEWVGLVVYRLTGRTDALFPGPRP